MVNVPTHEPPAIPSRTTRGSRTPLWETLVNNNGFYQFLSHVIDWTTSKYMSINVYVYGFKALIHCSETNYIG